MVKIRPHSKADGLRCDTPAPSHTHTPTRTHTRITVPTTENLASETCFYGQIAKTRCETLQPLNPIRVSSLQAKSGRRTGPVSQYEPRSRQKTNTLHGITQSAYWRAVQLCGCTASAFSGQALFRMQV